MNSDNQDNWIAATPTPSEARRAIRGYQYMDMVPAEGTPRLIGETGHYADALCWCGPTLKQTPTGYVLRHDKSRRN